MNLIVNEQAAAKVKSKPYIKATVSCPRCKNKFCDRMPRGPLVKTLLFWLPLKKYKCDKCFNRFYKIDK